MKQASILLMLVWIFGLNQALVWADDDDEDEDSDEKPVAVAPSPSPAGLFAGAGALLVPGAPQAAPVPPPVQATIPPAPPTVASPQVPTRSEKPVPISEDPEVAILHWNDRFYPARIHLREGQKFRLIFASLNRRPAALILEPLKIQRWVASNQTNVPNVLPEANRQLESNRITEIVIEPKVGSYRFHDALGGAAGEIQVSQ